MQLTSNLTQDSKEQTIPNQAALAQTTIPQNTILQTTIPQNTHLQADNLQGFVNRIQALPQELHHKIFSRLDSTSLGNLRLASKVLLSLVDTKIIDAQVISDQTTSQISFKQALLKFILTLKDNPDHADLYHQLTHNGPYSLKEYTLLRMPLTQFTTNERQQLAQILANDLQTQGFLQLSANDNITELIPLLHEYSIDRIVLNNLKDSQLEIFESLKQPIHGTGITHLTIDTDSAETTNFGLASIFQLQTLESLTLSQSMWLTDDGLAAIHKLTALNTLDISGCTRLTNSGLAHLTQLPSLKNLDVSRVSSITDTGLGHLSQLKALEYLNLNWCSSLTNSGLIALAPLPHLQHLELDLGWWSRIDDQGLEIISQIKQLKTLNLTHACSISGAGLRHLSALECLKTLQLGLNHNLANADVLQLKDLPSLEIVDLSYCTKVDSTIAAQMAPIEVMRLHSSVRDFILP